MTRQRVVIAGMGDSGLLTAIHLSRHADIVGITTRPGLLSGKEIGVRITRPDEWARDCWVPFERYKRLDGVRTIHATLTGLDTARKVVTAKDADGRETEEPYDVLVISTGASNGFWRRPELLTEDDVAAELASTHRRLADAGTVAVIGGGAAAVSSAVNLAATWPDKQVDLYFPGDKALPHHHPKVWSRLRRHLAELGVGVHAGHRAVIPEGFACDTITDEPVSWSTGQPPARADAVLWTIGQVRPHSDWLPRELLDEDGFVRVEPTLQLPGHPDVFAIGDVAATDPHRSSARNRADKMLARNIRAQIKGTPLQEFKPPRSHWGSVVGIQANGLEVFTPKGQPFRFPAWSIEHILNRMIVNRGIYRGVRKP